MTKRFGRNKRRAAREVFALVNQELDKTMEKLEAVSARYRALYATSSRAEEIAFERYLKNRHNIEEGMTMLYAEMGRELGVKLKPIAEQILNSRKPIEINFRNMADPVKDTCEVLSGCIRQIEYNIVIDRIKR